MALNAKQEAFAYEYIKDLNGRRAAIEVGYSAKTADQAASRLLKNVKVAELIQSLKKKRNESTQTDAEYVLRRLREIDELDVIDIMQDDLMAFKPLSEWPKAWRQSITGMDMHTITSHGDDPVETFVKKIKWPDKTKNLELIGRHVDVGAWKDEAQKVEVTNHIMPVPQADSAESWEQSAKANQEELLGG